MIEKIIDNNICGYDYIIRKHILNGWYIYKELLTITILRK